MAKARAVKFCTQNRLYQVLDLRWQTVP